MAPQENGVAYLHDRMERLEEIAREDKAAILTGLDKIVVALASLTETVDGMKTILGTALERYESVGKYILIGICIMALGNRAPEIIAEIIKAFHG